MIIEIPLDEGIFRHTEFKLKHMPEYKGSHRKLGANQTGVLGEVVAERWLSAMGIFYTADKVTTHDLRFLCDRTLDVKTKERSAVPRSDFDCSVPLYNHAHQRPDYYLFVSLLRNKQMKEDDLRRFTHAYITGVCTQERLERFGRVIETGTKDDDNGMENWTAMINISIDLLTHCDEILPLWLAQSPNVMALRDFSMIPAQAPRKSWQKTSQGNASF